MVSLLMVFLAISLAKVPVIADKIYGNVSHDNVLSGRELDVSN